MSSANICEICFDNECVCKCPHCKCSYCKNCAFQQIMPPDSDDVNFTCVNCKKDLPIHVLMLILNNDIEKFAKRYVHKHMPFIEQKLNMFNDVFNMVTSILNAIRDKVKNNNVANGHSTRSNIIRNGDIIRSNFKINLNECEQSRKVLLDVVNNNPDISPQELVELYDECCMACSINYKNTVFSVYKSRHDDEKFIKTLHSFIPSDQLLTYIIDMDFGVACSSVNKVKLKLNYDSDLPIEACYITPYNANMLIKHEFKKFLYDMLNLYMENQECIYAYNKILIDYMSCLDDSELYNLIIAICSMSNIATDEIDNSNIEEDVEYILNKHRTIVKYISEEIRKINIHTTYITACSVDKCTGYVDNTYMCNACWTKHCPRCHKILTDDHVCNPVDVESIRLIMHTQTCPTCHARIYKTTGCDHMHCTICDTDFDYITGNILSKRDNHNNNYHKYPSWIILMPDLISIFNHVYENNISLDGKAVEVTNSITYGYTPLHIWPDDSITEINKMLINIHKNSTSLQKYTTHDLMRVNQIDILYQYVNMLDRYEYSTVSKKIESAIVNALIRLLKLYSIKNASMNLLNAYNGTIKTLTNNRLNFNNIIKKDTELATRILDVDLRNYIKSDDNKKILKPMFEHLYTMYDEITSVINKYKHITPGNYLHTDFDKSCCKIIQSHRNVLLRFISLSQRDMSKLKNLIIKEEKDIYNSIETLSTNMLLFNDTMELLKQNTKNFNIELRFEVQ